MLHTSHERTLDNLYSLTIFFHSLAEILLQILAAALHDSLIESFLKSLHACRIINLSLSRTCLGILCCHHLGSFCDKSFCGLRVSVKYNILHALKQFRLDLIIDLKHGRIDNRHVHSCLDRVI